MTLAPPRPKGDAFAGGVPHERPFAAEGWGTILIALVTVMGFQAMRALFVLAYDYQERRGFAATGLMVAIVFLAPLAAPLLHLALGRWTLAATVVALTGVRIAMQPVTDTSLFLPAAGTMLFLVAGTLLVAGESTHEAAPRRFAIGVVAGLMLDTALRLAFGSWDYVWRSGTAAQISVGAVGAAALLAVWAGDEADLSEVAEPSWPRAVPFALVGPYLFLQVLFLQSPGFFASSGGVSLPLAGGLVLLADAGALWVLTMTGSASAPARRSAAALLVVFGWAATALTGAPLLALAMLAQVAATMLFAGALASEPSRRCVLATAVSGAVGGVLFVLMTFLYQIHYERPLPFSNELIPLFAAVLLGFAAVRRIVTPPPVHPIGSNVLATVATLMLAVPLVLWATAPSVDEPGGPVSSFRLMSYNIHSGVDVAGLHALENLAVTIESRSPDVVVFQEVSRGWPIGGMTDVAAWLERRLAMHGAWGPAMDGQAGNFTLSRFPIVSSRVVALPKGTGTMKRSALWVTLDLGRGRTVDVVNTHLQHRPQNLETRLDEIEVILREWAGRPRTVIAGDMNFDSPWPETEAFEAAGFVSVQDVTGHGDLRSAPSRDPVNRSDWIFGSKDLGFEEFSMPRTLASDHLPLLVTVELG